MPESRSRSAARLLGTQTSKSPSAVGQHCELYTRLCSNNVPNLSENEMGRPNITKTSETHLISSPGPSAVVPELPDADVSLVSTRL